MTDKKSARPAGIGHNSGADEDDEDFLDTSREKLDNAARENLRRFIERVERLEEEKKGVADDIRDVYGEAKANGYDVKTMRVIVRLRKMEKHHRDEADALLETYRNALGLH